MTHSKKMQDYVNYWRLSVHNVFNSATRRAQLSQKRVYCPHGTNANPWRGAVRHTSQDSSWVGGSDNDEFDAGWWRCRCRCCNLSFLRLVAAAAAVFCWAQYLCVCAHGMAHSWQKLQLRPWTPLGTSVPQNPQINLPSHWFTAQIPPCLYFDQNCLTHSAVCSRELSYLCKLL